MRVQSNWLIVVLLLVVLILSGCGSTVYVEKEVRRGLPEHLLVDPKVPPPPMIALTDPAPPEQVRLALDLMIQYSRELIKEIQNVTLNLRAARALNPVQPPDPSER